MSNDDFTIKSIGDDEGIVVFPPKPGYTDIQDTPTIAEEINPAIKRTISYAWPEAQYQLIARVANKENRKMRNMLFHMVEFYIKANKLEEKYPLKVKE